MSVFVPNGRGVFRLYQAGELRSAERGRLPRPRLGQRGRDTCGFPSSLNSYLSLGDSTAKIGEAGPLRNRGMAVGLPLRVFLRLFAVHRQITATHTGYFPQARHTRAAQLVSLEFADSTYGLGVRCNLSSQALSIITR